MANISVRLVCPGTVYEKMCVCAHEHFSKKSLVAEGPAVGAVCPNK